MRRAFALAATLVTTLASSGAFAAGFTDYDEDLRGPPEKVVEASGSLRMRGDILDNLDLDRGPTPSGQLLFPVPLSDPKGQILTRGDLRLRTDLALNLPQGGVSVKIRMDAFDGMPIGSAPEGAPAASLSQDPKHALLHLRWAYGEALTPFGLLTAGRMGNQFGLGMLANSGDCADCDGGDSVDRIAFITPVLGHLVALAYDFTSTGPYVADKSGNAFISIDPNVWVHTLTFAVMRYHTDLAVRRRATADKATFDYGLTGSYRWQNKDIPATYLPTAQPVPIDANQVTARGYSAGDLDFWARLAGPGYRVELEAAYLHAKVDQASLIPGVSYKVPVTSDQFGLAVESDFGARDQSWSVGLDGGYASGDPAPGFGAYPTPGQTAPKASDLDGPQANPPYDNTVNNFRFNPNYRIDRILFHEIIGTVTDAVYFRPHAQVKPVRWGKGSLELGLFAVFSMAVYGSSTPSGSKPLGIELDPTVTYRADFGFEAALEQATLFPLSGFDNPALNLTAKPAQLWRLRLAYGF